MQTADLDKKLVELRGTADEQFEHETKGHKLKYQNLAGSYVWWLKASWDSKYLDKLYVDNGIRANNEVKNQVTKADFMKLVKLIFVKHNAVKNTQTISDYAWTLFALYHRFSNDDAWLRIAENNEEQAINELNNYMLDAGGIGALKLKFQDKGEDEGLEIPGLSITKAEKTGQTPTEQRRSANNKALLNLQKTHLPNVKGQQLSPSPVITTDADDLAVLLVRRKGDSLEIIGSSADEMAVNAALLDAGLTYDDDVAPSLRLLCEALAVHAPPKQAVNARARLYPKYIAKVEGDDGELIEIKQICYPRLLIQKDGNMLISKRHQQASLTSVVIPNTPLSKGSELFLRGNDRDYLEQELINNKFLPLYTAKTNARLVKTADGVRAKKQLTLKHNFSQFERNLYFYETSYLNMAGETKIAAQQPIPNIPKQHKFNFKLVADQELLELLAAKITTLLQGKNTIFHKSPHIPIDLDVRNAEIVVHEYWLNGKYDRRIKIPFTQRTRLTKTAVKTSKAGVKGIRINAMDVWQIFQVLPKLKLKNKAVTIEGSTELLKFGYQTELASYEVYVPAANEFGTRSADMFAEYEFVKSD